MIKAVRMSNKHENAVLKRLAAADAAEKRVGMQTALFRGAAVPSEPPAGEAITGVAAVSDPAPEVKQSRGRPKKRPAAVTATPQSKKRKVSFKVSPPVRRSSRLQELRAMSSSAAAMSSSAAASGAEDSSAVPSAQVPAVDPSSARNLCDNTTIGVPKLEDGCQESKARSRSPKRDQQVAPAGPRRSIEEIRERRRFRIDGAYRAAPRSRTTARELAAEEALHKKFRKGKLTKAEYEEAVLRLDRGLEEDD